MRAVNDKFIDLGQPRRVWAVAAINGDLERLMTLHDNIATRFQTRDRIVYMGNYLGVNSRHNKEVVEEMLAFRAALMAKPGMEATDIVHLRGPAEEAWQRLLRLQFAPVPAQALDKLLASGVEAFLRLYGMSLNDAKSVARTGSVAITRWTNQLRAAQRAAPGHEALMCSTRRAAQTEATAENPQRLLFVPAGFDPARTLEDQGDAIWWQDTKFESRARAATTYSRIVRGFDETRMGLSIDGAAVTLDGGCGRGGPLVCGAFTATGRLTEILTIGGQGAVTNRPVSEQAAAKKPALVPAEKPMWQPDLPLAMSA